MLDLSHLTEEEQEMIMTVLKRDADLKKAEEERIGKLQEVVSTGSRPESSLKYLTGEWFYEAKSRRHMDKIHGSEIILASMKQWKSHPLDGSLRLETAKTLSDRGSDSVPPPKPARQLEPTQCQEMSTLAVENDKLNSEVRSPARTRHNPFNRASLILEAPERADEMLINGNSEVRKSSETDHIAPLKNHAAGQASQMSGGSTTSDCSSVGFKPVPKKRTFVSRRSSTPSTQSDGSGLGTQPGPTVILPAPRRSLRFVSNGISKLPSLEGTGEQSQKSTTTKSNDVASSEQALKTADVISQQPHCDAAQVSLHIDLEMDRNTPSIATDRQTANSSDKSYHKPSIKESSPPAERNKNDRPTDRATPNRSDVKGDMTQRDHGETQADSLSTATIQDAERMKNGRVEAVMRQGDLSFTQSIEDEPICYDLDFIDKPTLHTRTKSNPNLMLQTPNPSGEEEDSIAKVLEWFSRSTDSNDWLDKEGGHQAIVNIDRKADISVEDSVTKDMDIYKNRNRDRKREAPEMKRAHREAKDGKDSMEPIKLRAIDRMEIQEVMHEEARKCNRPQEVKETEDESQPPKISHLKSFWEKGNTGPKILISRSNTNSDKGQKPTLPATEKDREKEVNENQCLNSDMFSAPGLYGGKVKYEKDAFNVKDKQEKELQPLSQQKDKDSIENVQLNITPKQQTEYTAETHTSPGFMGNNQSPGTQRKDDIKYSTDYMSLPDNAQVVDRRGSDTEIMSLTRSSSQPKMQFVSGLSPESETFSPLTSSPQPDSLPQARGSPLPIRSSSSITTPQHEDLIDANLQARASPDSEKLYQYRHSPYLDRRSTKMQMQRSSSEDVKRKDNEERNVHSCTSPKKQDDSISKDRSNSPHSQRHAPQRQESTAERIKQLKAFWEQERNKPANYTGLSKGSGDAKATRCTNLGKLNNRFTKSAYDLRSIGNDSSSDDEGNRQHFAILTMNQRLDKLSPTIGVNRVQFKNLRQFWGEATSNCKGSFDKPKKKDQIEGDSLAVGSKQCVDPELYKPTPVQAEKTSTRPAVMKSSSHSQTQKSPHDRQFGSVSGTGNDNKSSLSHYFTTESGQLRDSRRGSKDSTREEKPPKLLSNVGKETRSPKAKRDHLSGRGSSLCRATSMFSLNVTEDNEEPFPGQLKKNQEASPVQDRRQGADRTQKRRQNADKGVISRRPTEDSESLAPRARAFVPRDYRHYLGMTEKTSVHTSLAPAVKEQGLEGKPAYDLDSTGPMRASTPMGSEERYGWRVSKTSPRPLRGNSGSDTGRDSSISSASDTWSSRNSSNRENDDEDQNPVRRALRRAEARPKNLAKSLEDITASLTPRQERRQDPIVDLRRSSDAPSIPSPSSSSFSDPEHLKKMSKSVPSFLQKEVDGTEPDSTSEDSYHGHRPKTGRSMTNLSNSSGMASSFSLSGSVMTMYSGDYGSVEVQGNIQFSINYVQKLREFHIFVAQCRDLAAVDPKRGRSDPYVKSYLVPDNANLGKRKTSVRKKTQNPTFNEILRYRVRMEYLRTQTLILSVWHHDTFGKNSFLGEVDVDLSKWDFDHTQMNYLALKARPTSSVGPSDDRGEMRLAIRFLPQITHSEGTAKDGPNTGEIHIWVKECKNLPLIRATIDPYIKCFVLPDTSRKSRQKTRVLRRTVDPIFNHTMVYDGIRQEDLTDACVELTVWDRDRLASNLLGGMRLGLGTGRSYGAVVDWMDSTTYEVALWERMMASPSEWVEDVLPLRMLTPAKTALK